MSDQGFLDGKTISCGNSYISLFIKHSYFLRVGGWRVSIISHLYIKCWQTRGRLLNSWNSYQKLHINRVKWSLRKMELEKNNHIDSSILTFRDMYFHVIVRKKSCFIIFCIKLTIYKKIQIFKKNSYKNLFFILLLYYTLTEKHHGNALSKKEKLQ